MQITFPVVKRGTKENFVLFCQLQNTDCSPCGGQFLAASQAPLHTCIPDLFLSISIDFILSLLKNWMRTKTDIKKLFLKENKPSVFLSNLIVMGDSRKLGGAKIRAYFYFHNVYWKINNNKITTTTKAEKSCLLWAISRTSIEQILEESAYCTVTFSPSQQRSSSQQIQTIANKTTECFSLCDELRDRRARAQIRINSNNI